MSAHIAFPALRLERTGDAVRGRPHRACCATRCASPAWFVTDALMMGAIVARYGAGEATVRAFLAGSDLLLIPADADSAVLAMTAAVASGRVTRERLAQSVRRVLEIKRRLGLLERRTVPIDSIPSWSAAGASSAANDLAVRSLIAGAPTWADDCTLCGRVPPPGPDRVRRRAELERRRAPYRSVAAGRRHGGLLPAVAHVGTLSYDSARAVIARAADHGVHRQRAADLGEGKHRPSGLTRPAHHSDGRGPPHRVGGRSAALTSLTRRPRCGPTSSRGAACGPRSARWRSRCSAACRSAATSRLASAGLPARLGSERGCRTANEARVTLTLAHLLPRVRERHQGGYAGPGDRGGSRWPLPPPSASTARASQTSSPTSGRSGQRCIPRCRARGGTARPARACSRRRATTVSTTPGPLRQARCTTLPRSPKWWASPPPACCWSIRASSTSMHPHPLRARVPGGHEGTRHGSTPVDPLGGPRCRSPVVRLHGNPCRGARSRGHDDARGTAGLELYVLRLSAIVLMQAVERVTGRPFDRFLTGRVFGPGGMSATRFLPPASLRDRIAPTEHDTLFRPPLAPRRSARRECGTPRWHLGERRALLQRTRPLPFRRDAVERGGVGHTAAGTRRDRRGVHPASEHPGGLHPRTRLGYPVDSGVLERRAPKLSRRSFGHTGLPGRRCGWTRSAISSSSC